jgi:hypothetical protein
VRLAAQRHLDDLARSKRKDWPYYDPWHGNDVCDFIEKLPHVEGSWDTPTILLEPARSSSVDYLRLAPKGYRTPPLHRRL